MKHKTTAWILAAAMLFTLLSGCGAQEKPTVSVQSVGLLCGIGSVGLQDRYAGVVIAGESVPVERDEEMQIKDLLVSAGDLVETGDLLFTYDTDAISLSLDKMRLELEQLNASIELKTAQIEQLEKEKEKAKQEDQLDYTLQIQELQVDLTEAAMEVKTKQQDIEQTETYLENDKVVAPSSGRIQKINENGGVDELGNPLPFISIMQVSVYRVKGIVNEQNAAALMVDMPVSIRSRADSEQLWSGKVDSIDWENPIQNNDYWGPKEEMTQSSSYPFYISLEADDGLMLGQHVYIEPYPGDAEEETGLALPSWCLNDAQSDSPWVWAVDAQKHLEKRPVKLGGYNETEDTYLILDGLAALDYVAPPGEDCVEGANVVFYSESDFDTPVNTKDASFDGGFCFEEGLPGKDDGFGFVEGSAAFEFGEDGFAADGEEFEEDGGDDDGDFGSEDDDPEEEAAEEGVGG